jgi:hypothetical protein
VSREPDEGCPREREGFHDIYKDSEPEMIVSLLLPVTATDESKEIP